MMKNLIFLTTLFLTLLFINTQTANAQEKRLNSSPRAFQTFYAKFKSAVMKNDTAATASMTVFPFKYGFDAGDEGTMSKVQFIKRFGEIFGASPQDFFTERNPRFSRGDKGSYNISTEDAAHLIFVKKGSTFEFSAYIVEP